MSVAHEQQDPVESILSSNHRVSLIVSRFADSVDSSEELYNTERSRSFSKSLISLLADAKGHPPPEHVPWTFLGVGKIG